jgi:hypothetical protein
LVRSDFSLKFGNMAKPALPRVNGWPAGGVTKKGGGP